MLHLDIDHLIVVAFLVITLIIGLRAGRGIKDIREYATANKMFGTGALVLTFLATNVAGESILDLAGEVNKTGIILSVVFIVGVGGLLVIQALFIAPNITYFEGSMTMGDVMEVLYGSNSKIITGILGFFTAICVAGMEIIVLGLLCESLLGLDYRWGVGLGGLLLAVYSAHGGIKSVTATDVFQFIILLVVLPMLTVLALKQAGGIRTVFTQIPVEKLQIMNHPNRYYYLVLLMGKVVFQFSMIDPALIQRFLMAKHRQQLRNMFLTLAIFSSTLYLTIMLVGLAGAVIYPHLSGTYVVPTLINNLLPIGIKGLTVAGLIAVTMATIDSFLHAAGLTLTHDVMKPIFDKNNWAINELRWTQYVTVFVSLFAIIIGFTRADDLYGILLISYEFTCPILAFPLWGGIMGLKPDRVAFYVAAGVTTVALLLARWLLPESQGYFSALIGVLVNGIVFLGIHVVRNKGLVVVSRRKEYGRTYKVQQHKEGLLGRLRKLVPTPQNVVAYSRLRVARYGAPYMLLGIFFILNYIIPYFMWEYDNTQAYELMLYLRFLGATFCALLIVKEKWPQSLLPYLPTFWHFTLLYCLPFTSTVMFLTTQGSTEWLINVAITIMFLIVLVDWVSFIILTMLGVTFGFLFYRVVMGPISLQLDFSTGYLLVYQAIFATSIGLLFARRKQQRFDKLVTEKQTLAVTDEENKSNLLAAFKEKVRLLRLLKQAGIEKLPHITRLTKTLRAQEQEGAPLAALVQELDDTLTPMTVALEKLENRAMEFLQLNVETIAVDKLLAAVQTQLRAQDLHRGVHFVKHTKHQELACDPVRIGQLLVQCIASFRTSADEVKPLQVVLEDTHLLYPIRSIGKDYVKQVPALCFVITTKPKPPPLAEHYTAQMNGSALSIPETSQGLLWHTQQRIIKAHYGYSSLSDDTSKDTYLYVIPVRINEVRPKDMDKPDMELGAEIVRADDTYPGAQAQEKALLKAIQHRTTVNLDLVKTAIEMIKWYHGAEKRKSGEPFYLHPLAVAQIVLDYNQDEATVLGALLHDTVEDTPMLLENIETIFGREVASIVDGVTHLESNKDTFYKVTLSTHENLLMLLEAEDQRVLYVKLADRMHNIRTIGAKSHKSQRKTAEETLQFFVPLAKQLGLQKAAEELKASSVQVLNGN